MAALYPIQDDLDDRLPAVESRGEAATKIGAVQSHGGNGQSSPRVKNEGIHEKFDPTLTFKP